jgi:hypothetical protein
MFIPLDIAGSGFTRLTPDRFSISVDRAVWKPLFDEQIKQQLTSFQHQLDKHDRTDGSLKRLVLDSWKVEITSPAEGDEPETTLAMQAAKIELLQMQLAISTMGDTNPGLRSSWDVALDKLRKETFCPALRDDLDSFKAERLRFEGDSR